MFQPITNTIAAALSADGRLLAVADGERKLSTWDVITRQGVAGPWPVKDSLDQLCFNPVSKALVSATRTGELELWDAASGSRLAGVTGLGSFSLVRFSPDGRDILVSGHREAAWLEAATPRILWREPALQTVKIAVPGPNATALVFSEKGMRWWNPESGRPLSERAALGRMAEDCRISAYGQRAIVCNYARHAWVYSLRTLTPTVAEISHPTPVSRLAASHERGNCGGCIQSG